MAASAELLCIFTVRGSTGDALFGTLTRISRQRLTMVDAVRQLQALSRGEPREGLNHNAFGRRQTKAPPWAGWPRGGALDARTTAGLPRRVVYAAAGMPTLISAG